LLDIVFCLFQGTENDLQWKSQEPEYSCNGLELDVLKVVLEIDGDQMYQSCEKLRSIA